MDEDKERGIDRDLVDCLNSNPVSFDISEIARVLASWEGEADFSEWYWILQLVDGRYVLLSAECCYSGWDLCSSARIAFIATPYDALALVEHDETVSKAREALMRQLAGEQRESWRKRMDEEFEIRTVIGPEQIAKWRRLEIDIQLVRQERDKAQHQASAAQQALNDIQQRLDVHKRRG